MVISFPFIGMYPLSIRAGEYVEIPDNNSVGFSSVRYGACSPPWDPRTRILTLRYLLILANRVIGPLERWVVLFLGYGRLCTLRGASTVNMWGHLFMESFLPLQQAGIGCSAHFIPLHLHPYLPGHLGLPTKRSSGFQYGISAHCFIAVVFKDDRSRYCLRY